MRLKQQTLLLLSVPLLFEVIFICVLMQALYNAEQDFLAEAQNREISMCVNNIMRDMLQAVTQLGSRYLIKKTDFQVSQVGTLLEDILAQRTTLNKLIANDTRKKKQFAEFNNALDTQLVTFDEFRDMMNGHHELQALQVLRKLNSLLSTVNESGSEIIQSYERRGEKRKLAVEHSRQRVRAIIIFGAGFNLLLVAGLGWWTVRFSLSRLKTLMRNNERLAKHEPLLEPIAGNDEYAELDRTFHSMVSALDQAKKKEREFVSMISHDIRSPLGGLQSTLELFSMGRFGELNDKGRTALSKADIAIGRILSITEGLLELDKLESGEFELDKHPTDLRKLISEAVSIVQSQAEQNQIKLITELHFVGGPDSQLAEITDPHFTDDSNPDLANSAASQHAMSTALKPNSETSEGITLSLDQVQILRVLVNLLTNAIKFSDKNSQVKVCAKNDNSQVTVEVNDTGRGIPQDKVDSVFERYVQVELADSRQKKGTGLGLPICKAIVQAHGGTMGVTSEFGKGSTFWFRLPLQKQ